MAAASLAAKCAYELAAGFWELIQNMSKNVELIEFARPRMKIIMDILSDILNSGSTTAVVDQVAELIKESNHTFTKILKRGTCSKFFHSSFDKSEIQKITRNLDS